MTRHIRISRLLAAIALTLLASCATQEKAFPLSEIPARVSDGIQSALERMVTTVQNAGKREYGPIPDADPKRKVNEQDCTQPIAPEAGNLRCK